MMNKNNLKTRLNANSRCTWCRYKSVPYGETSVPVLSGVSTTDWVVIAGVHLLREGQAVRAVDNNNREVAAAFNAAIATSKTAKLTEPAMSNFNLSAWALNNRTLVLFIMMVLAVAGVVSYQRLGQSEDPPFTFKIMVVRTMWPGATAEEVSMQVTDRIEKKLMETGSYEFIRSYSRPGESLVMFMAKDSMFSDKLPELFYQSEKNR